LSGKNHVDEKKQSRRERRRSQRFLAKARCWITGHRSALYTPLCNISRGGLSVGGMTPFQEGDEVSVRIPSGPRAELVARSRVVWTRDHGDDEPAGMGAEFLEIEGGELVLEKLLDED
jgi:Tfp pilus assembly protein PilZ